MEVSRKMEIEAANAIQKGAASTSEQDTKIQQTIAERALLAQAITTASSSDMIPLTDNVRKILCDKGHLYQDQAEAPKGLVESVLSNLDDELHSLQSTKRKHTLSRSEEVEETESELDIEDEEEVEKPATRTFSPRIEMDETLDQVHECLEEIAKSHPEIDIQEIRTRLQEKESQYRADLDKEDEQPGLSENQECSLFQAPIFIAKIVDQMKWDLIEFFAACDDLSILEELEKRAVESKEGQNSLLVKLIICVREPSLENLLDCGVVDIDNSDFFHVTCRITGDSVEKILEKWVTHLFQVLPPESALRMIEIHIHDQRTPQVSLSQVKAILLRHSPIDVPTFVKKYPEFLNLSVAFMDIDELYQACQEHDEREYRTESVQARLLGELPLAKAYEHYRHTLYQKYHSFGNSAEEMQNTFDYQLKDWTYLETRLLFYLYKNISQHPEEFFEFIQKELEKQAVSYPDSTRDFQRSLLLLYGFRFRDEYFTKEQQAQAAKMFDSFLSVIENQKMAEECRTILSEQAQEIESLARAPDFTSNDIFEKLFSWQVALSSFIERAQSSVSLPGIQDYVQRIQELLNTVQELERRGTHHIVAQFSGMREESVQEIPFPSPDQKDATGHTLLFRAVEAGHVNLVREALSRGATVERTLLRWAMFWQSAPNLVKVLLEAPLVPPVSKRFLEELQSSTSNTEVQNLLTQKIDSLDQEEPPKTVLQLLLPAKEDLLDLWNDVSLEALHEVKEPFFEAVQSVRYREACAELKRVPALKRLLESPSLVREGYSVEEHTLMVLERSTIEQNFVSLEAIEQAIRQRPDFASFDVKRFLGALLVFHDIGKSLGQNPAEQHIFTTPALTPLLGAFGFSPAEIQLAQVLVDNDILGEWQKGSNPEELPTENEVVAHLTSLADKAGVGVDEYFQLQRLLYISDASSYPYIRKNFMKEDPKTGRATFLGEASTGISRLERVDRLMAAPEGDFLTTILEKLRGSEAPLTTLFFDSIQSGSTRTIFDIAKIVRENQLALRPILGEDLTYEAAFLASYVGDLERDGYTAEHACWSLNCRVLLRQAIPFPSLRGLQVDSKEFIQKIQSLDVEEKFYQTLNSLIEKDVDFKEFFDRFFLTVGKTCHAFKLLSALSRKSPLENYVWTQSPEGAFRQLQKNLLQPFDVSLEQAQIAFAALQAYTVEMLEQTEFPGKHPDRTVELIRTESLSIMRDIYHVSQGSSRTITRSALDCASIGTAVYIYGCEITRSKVPFHRIVGAYFLSPDRNTFGYEKFNGVTFQPDELVFDYPGTLVDKELLEKYINSFETIATPLDYRDQELVDFAGVFPMTYQNEAGEKVKVYVSRDVVHDGGLTEEKYNQWAQQYQQPRIA